MKRLAVACLLLAACSSETEVMLVVKAARSLQYGEGAAIDALQLQAEVASDPSHLTANKTVDLCSLDLAGTPNCRPQQYVDETYDGELTLPIHILMRPGSAEATSDVDVFVLAQKTVTDANNAITQVRLRTHLQFTFSAGHRLWLDVPLYGECLDIFSCQDVKQICKADCPPDANGLVPATCCDSVSTSDDEPSEDLLSGIAHDLSSTIADLAIPPQACGQKPNDPCCPTGMACPLNTTCDGTFCQSGSTGGRGQPCNPDGSCGAELMCTGNICLSSCGQPGGRCCVATSNPCDNPPAGQRCFNDDGTEAQGPAQRAAGTCEPCGEPTQQCCPRLVPTGNGFCSMMSPPCNNKPNTSFRCPPCGESGQNCCPPASCNGNALYCNSQSSCAACGALNQICCPGNRCNGGTPTQMFSAPWQQPGHWPSVSPDAGNGGTDDLGILPFDMGSGSLPDAAMPPPSDLGTSGGCVCL